MDAEQKRLNKSVFEKIIEHFQFHKQIDLFVSSLNNQLPIFDRKDLTQKPHT